MPSLLFRITGHDELSDVFDDIGDAARRLHRRISTMTTESDRAMHRFTRDTSTRLAGMRQDADAGEKALGELRKTAMLLAPAAIPAAASLAPLAAGAGAVAVASVAMAAAMGPQISKLGEASDAQKKYEEAVDKSGASSQEAVAAQQEYLRLVAQMPAPTQRAAAAVKVLKDDYQDWSDSLAGDTMAPFIKGVAITNTLLPKTAGLVKAASGEADRFMTIVGGEIASPGLDKLNSKFTNFAQSTMRKVNDEMVHLLRVGEGAEVGGPAREFMDWARAQGPTVAGVLMSVATALVHVLEAGSDVGVGLLQSIEVLAHLVSAVPPSAIALFLQLALALKVTKAAALGLAAGRTALAAFGVQLVAMQTAAAAAPTRLRSVAAAFGALSRASKAALVGTGIGLLVLALSELSKMGKQAPPDVDRLTTSLGNLAQTGKVSGEAARAFGGDLGGLADSLRTLSRPSNLDKTQQFLTSLVGMDSTPVKEAKADLDAVDKALAGLVQSGKADVAQAAFDRVAAAMRKQGMSSGELSRQLGDYRSALADAKFEQDLVAQSQGLFGAQAQKTQAALAAQKASADGLRQSLQALNDVQRAGLGGMIGFEAAVDAAAKAAKENAGALDMSGGKLNLSSEKARNAASALQDLASKTDEAAASARESGSSWQTVNGIYARGREQLVKSAQQMGLTRAEAEQLAAQILKTPSKTAKIRMETEDATRDLNAFNAKVRQSPGSKSVTLKTISSAAEQVLKNFGYKVTHLPNGKVKISASGGQALGVISSVKGAIGSLHDRHITLTTENRTIYTGKGGRGPNAYASGGTPRAGELAMVGEEGPELVVFGQAARVFDAKTTKSIMSGTAGAGRAASQGLAVGLGSTGGVYSAARVMAGAVTAGIRDELEIRSPSKKTKALAWDVAHGFLQGLTGSRDKIKSVSADLVKDIKTAFAGKKESGLVAMVNKQTKKLLDLAAKRDAIAKKIAEAKGYAADVTKGARESAGLSNLGMEPDQVTAGGIKAGLAQKLAQIKQFSSYVSILAKRGLNKGLIRQILNMGPEAGYAYASALAGADKATFAQINKTQGLIDSESKKLGNKGADILYDSGKNAGKGFLTGLQGQKKNIENLMMDIAKGMQKSIKKALGIKSPSTVMAKLGAFSTQGFARGLVDAMPYLDSSLAAVTGRVAATQPVLGRPAVIGRGGGGTVVHIHVDGAVVDTLGFAKAAREAFLELKRANGGRDLGIA